MGKGRGLAVVLVRRGREGGDGEVRVGVPGSSMVESSVDWLGEESVRGFGGELGYPR